MRVTDRKVSAILFYLILPTVAMHSIFKVQLTSKEVAAIYRRKAAAFKEETTAQGRVVVMGHLVILRAEEKTLLFSHAFCHFSEYCICLL